jgi:hypothetical protein
MLNLHCLPHWEVHRFRSITYIPQNNSTFWRPHGGVSISNAQHRHDGSVLKYHFPLKRPTEKPINELTELIFPSVGLTAHQSLRAEIALAEIGLSSPLRAPVSWQKHNRHPSVGCWHRSSLNRECTAVTNTGRNDKFNGRQRILLIWSNIFYLFEYDILAFSGWRKQSFYPFYTAKFTCAFTIICLHAFMTYAGQLILLIDDSRKFLQCSFVLLLSCPPSGLGSINMCWNFLFLPKRNFFPCTLVHRLHRTNSNKRTVEATLCRSSQMNMWYNRQV